MGAFCFCSHRICILPVANIPKFRVYNKRIKPCLRQYYILYKPSGLLFEGRPKGTPISFTSLSNILKNSLKKVGINKKASIHSLRHSFATHLLEQGTNIKIIQRLLGHHSIRSTMVYLQVAQIDPSAVSSPFDNLNF